MNSSAATPPSPDPLDGPGLTIRVAVYGFLVALVTCVLLDLELYPFSAFRLFSEARTGEEVLWELHAVNRDGDELAVEMAGLGRPYAQGPHQLRHLAQAPPAVGQQPLLRSLLGPRNPVLVAARRPPG